MPDWPWARFGWVGHVPFLLLKRLAHGLTDSRMARPCRGKEPDRHYPRADRPHESFRAAGTAAWPAALQDERSPAPRGSGPGTGQRTVRRPTRSSSPRVQNLNQRRLAPATARIAGSSCNFATPGDQDGCRSPRFPASVRRRAPRTPAGDATPGQASKSCASSACHPMRSPAPARPEGAPGTGRYPVAARTRKDHRRCRWGAAYTRRAERKAPSE